MAPPTLKPLYFEKLPHCPTLKMLDLSWNVVRKLYAKVLGWEISCLTAWRVPESLGWSKKCKNVKIWPNNMTLSTDKDLKSNKFKGEKVYILAKDIDSRRKLEIKAKNISAWKRPIFLGHPNSGSFLQNAIFCLQNINTLKKLPLAKYTLSYLLVKQSEPYFKKAFCKGPLNSGISRVRTHPRRIAHPTVLISIFTLLILRNLHSGGNIGRPW